MGALGRALRRGGCADGSGAWSRYGPHPALFSLRCLNTNDASVIGRYSTVSETVYRVIAVDGHRQRDPGRTRIRESFSSSIIA